MQCVLYLLFCLQLVTLQTRLADWKDGGLSSKFMFSRLKQASQELQQYEESAAPPGWKCVWDRWAWWKFVFKPKDDTLLFPTLTYMCTPPKAMWQSHTSLPPSVGNGMLPW